MTPFFYSGLTPFISLLVRVRGLRSFRATARSAVAVRLAVERVTLKAPSAHEFSRRIFNVGADAGSRTHELCRRPSALRRTATAGGLAAALAWTVCSGTEEEVPKDQATPAPLGTGIYPADASLTFDDDDLVIPEIFTSHLPVTLREYGFRLRVNPHLGDFHHKEHLRISTRVRYGLTKNWEISAGSDLYFSHGQGEIGSFDRYGASNLRFGTKVNLGQPWFAGWNIGTGFEYIFPTGHPPAELTDGMRHFRPFITFSHRLETHRNARIFWGLRFDEVQHTSLPGTLSRNAFNESSCGITGGWVIDRKNLHYTFEASFDTTRAYGRSYADVFSLRPGIIWEIPSRRGPNFQGHWIVGVGIKSTSGPGGTSVGASFRLSYRGDIKPRGHQKTVPATP